MGRYTVIWSERAKTERRGLRSFLRPVVEKAVRALEHEAEVETLHRKKVNWREGMSPEFPVPAWNLRVGQHRVLYTVEGQTVRVLRVILKGGKMFGDSL